jgi:hypothetical protein
MPVGASTVLASCAALGRLLSGWPAGDGRAD